MFGPFLRRWSSPRRLAAAASLVLSAWALVACAPSTIQTPPSTTQAAPSSIATTPPASVTQPPPGAPIAAAGTVRIGLLLPLTGRNAELGNAMLDAAQMAVFEVADDKFQLLPHDTHGTAQGAAEAARAALGEGVRLIVGPLLAGEVEAVKPVAQGAGVPVVAFSTMMQLAGDGTYLIGFLPREEVTRVTAFAHAKGSKRFAALAPRSSYGEIAVEALKGAAAAQGAVLARVDYYDPAAPDFAPVVKRFAGAHDYDALLLPEGGAKLRILVPLLQQNAIDTTKVRLLGTGLWDEPGLGSTPGLAGGWYAAPAPATRADFEKRFRDLYQHAPPRLATLAYDATALAAVLARDPKGADFSAAALGNPSGFAGVDGIFRFRPDGLVQRGLAVIELHPEGNSIADPAPETFQQLGY